MCPLNSKNRFFYFEILTKEKKPKNKKNQKTEKSIFRILRTNEDNLIVLICLYFLIENILPLRFYFRIKKV